MGKGSDKPSESAEERELGRIAIEKWNDYQVRFKPIEDQFIQDVQRTESDYTEARGSANTAVQQAFGAAEDRLEDNIFASGLDPSSASFVKTMDSISTDRGLSAGTAINEAEMGVDNQHVKGLQTVVAMGQGQSAEAMDGMGSLAAQSTSNAINRANNSFNKRAAGLNAVGTAAGMATNYYMNNNQPNTEN